MRTAGLVSTSKRRLDADDGVTELIPWIRAVLAASRIPEVDAEDLLHDVVLVFLAKRSEVVAPHAWIASVARHRCLQYWNHHRRRRQRFVSEGWAADVVVHGLEDERIACRDALQRLPTKPRAVLVLRFWGGLDPRDIAQRTGLAPGSIDKTTRRALALLRRRLRAVRERRKEPLAGLAPPAS